MKHILVVDDNKINLTVTKTALNEDYKVTAVTMGAQALKFLEVQDCDLVLIDIEMPEMDGYELFERMKQSDRAKHIPAVFLTANGDQATRDKCLQMGGKDVIVKPAPKPELLRRIEAVLEDKNDTSSASDAKPGDEYESIEGIYAAVALSLAGSPEILSSTIEDFVRLSPKQKTELDTMYKEMEQKDFCNVSEQMTSYRITVHAMKTSAHLVGALALLAIAKRLEKAAKEEEIGPIKALHAFFCEEWDAMVTALACVIKKEDRKPFQNKEQVKTVLEKLFAAVEDLDLDTMDKEAKNLRGFAFDDELGDMAEAVSEAVLQIDYDSCKAYIEKMLKRLEN